MSTEVATIDHERGGFVDLIHRAADIMRQGGIVAFPTETLYGIGACATCPVAMDRLREIKQRSVDKAFTVHIGTRESASELVPVRSGLADRLIRKAWPGPVTLILDVENPAATPVAEGLDPAAIEAMYYDKTIGLRYPDDTIATELFRTVGSPVVAASANKAGGVASRDGKAVLKELDGRIDFLLDAGPTKYAKASTIIRVRNNDYELIREGVYDARTVERLATLRILFVCTGNTCRSPMAEGMAKKILAERLGCDIAQLSDRRVVVSSAGTAGGFGAASEHAVAVMQKHQIDIAAHQSASLTSDLIRQADYIYAMTRSHMGIIHDTMPGAEARTAMLVQDENIFDPIGGSEEDYERCARMIERGVHARLGEVEI